MPAIPAGPLSAPWAAQPSWRLTSPGGAAEEVKPCPRKITRLGPNWCPVPFYEGSVRSPGTQMEQKSPADRGHTSPLPIPAPTESYLEVHSLPDSRATIFVPFSLENPTIPPRLWIRMQTHDPPWRRQESGWDDVWGHVDAPVGSLNNRRGHLCCWWTLAPCASVALGDGPKSKFLLPILTV